MPRITASQPKQKKQTKKTRKVAANSNKQVIDALRKISETITSDLYLEDMLKLIVTITAEVMDSKICSLMLLDQTTHELSVKATQSISEEYLKKPNLKLGQGIAGIVAQQGKPIAVLDITKDERYLNREIAKKEHLTSLLSVPLVCKGKVTGVLNNYTEKPHVFTDSEIAILTAVAQQAAIVIEHFRLIVESKVIKEELESRKMIERAKGILMQRQGLSEDEAYTKIRRYSMDNRKNMRDVAEAIILNEDMQ